MFIEYKTFAIFKLSYTIFLSYIDLAEIVKVNATSKCRSLIDSQIIMQSSPLEMIAFTPLKVSNERVLT